MRILLTGAGGFLGSALVRYWHAHGHKLLLLARPVSRFSRLIDLLPALELVRASTTEEVSSVVRELMPDAIVHTACSYGRNGESELEVMNANLHFGIALLQGIVQNKFSEERFPTVFLNCGTVLNPGMSPYAASKTQFSAWGSSLAQSAPQRLKFINIRLQQVYGPGDDNSKFVTHVVEAFCKNMPRLALTEGEQRRDFIHINDVVLAYNRVLLRSDQFAASDEIDVGSGVAITIRNFVELAKQLSGARTILEFGAMPYRPNEAMHCIADTTRLRKMGWYPSTQLFVGLKQLIDWMR